MTNHKDWRIIFMGTPDFAVASLDKLVQAGCNIVAVVTAPDKPAGRGLLLQQSAIKKYAAGKNIPVLQPEKLKSPDFIAQLKALQPTIQIVVAFRMLPQAVWDLPPMGTINVHGSLLPNYRGAAPINWAVINGEKETGVTTFKLKHEIDTGNILLKKQISIGAHETAGEIHNRLMLAGADCLLETIEQLAAGKLIEQPQDANTASLKHAPKITTATCEIDWKKNGRTIYNLIRGLSPYPAAFTTLQGKKLKIYFAEQEIISPKHDPGEVDTDRKTYLRFACSDGYIRITDLQLEGKKRMKVEDFLRGFHFT